MNQDYFTLLGVARDASDEQIRHAYRRLAMRHHPDRNLGNAAPAEMRFKAIKQAYETLADPERRADYEASLDGLAAGEEAPAEAARGEDVRCEIEIPLEMAVFGGRHELQAKIAVRCEACSGSGVDGETEPPRCPDCFGIGKVYAGFSRNACPRCEGSGRLRVACRPCRGRGLTRRLRKVAIGVPAGVVEGTVIRVPEAGSDSLQGGTPGAIYCKVRIAPHARYRVDGQDLHADVTLDCVTALLGGTIETETPWGAASVTVPELTRAGDLLQVDGRGLQNRRDGSRGHLFLRATIDLPQELTRLNAMQRTALRMWFA